MIPSWLGAAIVAALSAFILMASDFGDPAPPRERLTRSLSLSSHTPGLVVAARLGDGFAAAAQSVSDEPAPVRQARILHGACSDADWTCDRLKGALPGSVVAACGVGNAVCEDGGVDWVGDGSVKADHLDAYFAETAVNEPAMAARDNLLVGFSRGAFVARDVALARPGTYSALVLVGASIKLEPEALRAAGIRRVVLACGELDMAAPSMRSNLTKLVAGGLEARFVSLGRVYHTLPADASARLADAVAWAAELPTERPLVYSVPKALRRPSRTPSTSWTPSTPSTPVLASHGARR